MELKSTVIELMDAVAARGICEFELETDEFKVKLKTGAPAAPAIVTAPAAAQPVQAPAAASAIPAGRTVEAPLVGVFYASPAPEEAPFIEVGQRVEKGDTLFIIEAMKTMNEIAAPCAGRVSHILAQSGDLLEFGQAVVVLEEE